VDTSALIRRVRPFNSIIMRAHRCIRLFTGSGLALLLAVGLSGCGNERSSPAAVVAEADDQQYQQGEQLLKDEHTDEALTAFLNVIKVRSDEAPESHLEAGRIYLTAKNDPISAIYHFKAYLVAKPNSDQAPMVAELIDTAKKNFARALPGGPNAYNESDLLDQIKGLQMENENLRHQLGLTSGGHVTGVSLDSIPQATGPSVSLAPANNSPNRAPAEVHAAAPTPTPVAVTAAPAPAVATVATSGRTYTVQAGDTLSSISLKELGSRARYMEIYNANRDQLPKPESLHIGQILKIPAK